MSVVQSSKLRVVSVLSGMVFSLAGWMFLSTPQGAAFLQDLTGKELRVLPTAPDEKVEAEADKDVVQLPADVAINSTDIPFFESALFGMQEAMKSVTEVVEGAVSMEAGSSTAFQSSSREMVRNVGGAKFVSNR